MPPRNHLLARAAVIAALLLIRSTSADVLPDNRADVFYSKYSGGGMDITGYSATARAKVTENLALEANYFVDKVSGASVDVLSQASVIKDTRKQTTGTVEYLRDKTTYTASYSTSKERDYISDTASIGLSQSMFGDLTTITLGFSNSHNKVGENNGTADDPVVAWIGHSLSRAYSGGVSQIITKNFITGVNFQVITDAGYLANPYRSIRYLDPSNAKGYSLASQVYPDTHTSTAVQVQGKYYLPYRAAVTALYRYYNDTWGVIGHTAEIDYTHPIRNKWIFEGRFRYYKQNSATFYRDLFDFNPQLNFEARDRNLAAQDNYTIGAKVTYAFLPDGWKVFKRGTFTADISHIHFNYLDFRNIKDYGVPQYQPGEEPLYKYNATVLQLYVSMYF